MSKRITITLNNQTEKYLDIMKQEIKEQYGIQHVTNSLAFAIAIKKYRKNVESKED